jgi:uncharacterized protein YjiK
MKFAKVMLVSVALSLFASAASAATWPTVTAQNIGSALPSSFEHSGLIYQANVQKLFVVSDEGRLAKMNLDGSGTPTVYSVGGDNEAVTVTSTTSTHVYIGIENPDSILQVNASTGVAGYSWDLTPWMTGTANQGLEALAYVPNEYISDSFTADSSQGGLFYAGMQGTGDIYIFDVNRSVNGSVSYRKTITDPTNTSGEGADLADLYFDSTSGHLFALYDGANQIKELTTSGSVVSTRSVPGNGQEGLYFTYSGNSVIYYIAQDDDTIANNGVYKYSDVDNDGTATVSDCNDSDATISSNRTYYRDADGDGLGSSSVTTSVCSLTAPSGYVTTATDQNDSDYDNDGVSTSSDCNDADSSVSSYLTVYQDYDGDGLGNPAVSQQVCALTAPTGYVTNANDTDDSGVVIVVPPTYSQIEYLNNNIDDDGDGVVDEWNTLSSNGVHPVYGSYDPSSSSLYSQTVTSIAGASNGAIKVKFIDGSGYRYNVLSRGSTTVSSYSGAYLLVRSGKRYALVNAYTGAVLDSLRTTASKRRVSVHLKTLSLHRK